MRYLAGEAGIRQFLDIGTGLPTVDNTHEVAQRVAPDSRVVYVDNDPLVLAHARALLTGTPEGATDYIDADLRDPEAILAAAAKTLDFDQPVALMLMGIAGYISRRRRAVRHRRDRLVDALPSGSYLALCDGVNVITGEALDRRPQDGLQRERRAPPYTPAQPRGVRRLLRRAGAGRAGRGVRPAVAAGPRPVRLAGRGRRAVRRGPQAVRGLQRGHDLAQDRGGVGRGPGVHAQLVHQTAGTGSTSDCLVRYWALAICSR